MSREDFLRKVIQLAVEAGRKRQSLQTGFVHYNHQTEDNVHDTIPIYENLLFALALMRTRVADNIREGREIVERLLQFKNKDGDFPEYIHEFPKGHKDFKVAVPFKYMVEDFGSVLGEEFNAKLKSNAGSVMEQQEPDLWNGQLGCYCGPHYGIFYDGFEPQVTVRDLYMAYLSGIFPARVLRDSLIHLQGALIRPTDKTIDLVDNNEIITPEPPQPHLWKGHAYYCHLWGSTERVHSLLLQGGNIRHFNNNLLELGELIPHDDRLEQREVCFYLDKQPMSIAVNGIPASTFRMGDEVTLTLEQKKIRLRFSLEKGEGEFMGHVMPGNRPGQLACKGKDRYEAYDWQIFLRTIRRSDPCVIRYSVDYFS